MIVPFWIVLKNDWLQESTLLSQGRVCSTLGMFVMIHPHIVESSRSVRGDCSAKRPKRNPLSRVAVDELAKGRSNEREVDEQGAKVRNGVAMSGDKVVKQDAVTDTAFPSSKKPLQACGNSST